MTPRLTTWNVQRNAIAGKLIMKITCSQTLSKASKVIFQIFVIMDNIYVKSLRIAEIGRSTVILNGLVLMIDDFNC